MVCLLLSYLIIIVIYFLDACFYANEKEKRKGVDYGC